MEHRAEYHQAVELSGWVYDFEILGSYVSDPWTSLGEETIPGRSISFANRKDEFYTGIYNRTGETTGTEYDTMQRRILDGKLEKLGVNTKNSIVPRFDTIPLTNGSSEAGAADGILPKGSNITFSIKTMGNLNDSDKVVIRPTFTYYTADMSKSYEMEPVTGESSEFALFYHSPETGNYVQYDSYRDVPFAILDYMENGMKSAFSDEDMFYTVKNRVNYTADLIKFGYKDESQKLIDLPRLDQYARKKTQTTASLANIELTNWSMMYDVTAYDQIKGIKGKTPNLYKNTKDEENYLETLKTFNSDKKEMYENMQKQSVQTWYGKYTIPHTLKVLDLSKIQRTLEDGTVRKYNSLHDYLAEYPYLTGDEDFWAVGGYLKVNFDVTVYKGDEAYMTMNYGTSNQWQRQGQKEEAIIMTRNSIDRITSLLPKGFYYNPDLEVLRDAVDRGCEKVKLNPKDAFFVDCISNAASVLRTDLVWVL